MIDLNEAIRRKNKARRNGAAERANGHANGADGSPWPPGYDMHPSGLWHDPGNDEPALWVCGPFSVLGRARDPQGTSWAVAIEWQDADGVPHRAFVPLADLIGDGSEVLRPLVDGGLTLAASRKAPSLLKRALASLDVPDRVRLVKRCGWHGDMFALPNRTFGQGGERVVFDGRADAARYAVNGTLEDWTEHVARPCSGNSRLLLCASIALAGVLCDLLEDEGGGVHLVGDSSTGKSTGLVVAGSTWGGGSRNGFVQSWRATGNALESIARAHSATLLALDELGELDAREAGSVAYLLINGQGKGRATKEADARVRAEWRIMLLSAGEVGLADKIAEGGRRAKAGQLVRLVDVPADAGAGLGLFENTHGADPATFARDLKAASLRSYGTAGPAFVEALARDPAGAAEEARTLIAVALRRLLNGIADPDGQVRRVAHRFALIAAAGEMAQARLGLPWRDGEPEWASHKCFDAWRTGRGGDDSGEMVAALAAIRETIERHGESRFRSILDNDTVQHPIRDLLGYIVTRDGETLWGFTLTGWAEVLSGIAAPSAIARTMADRGLLKWSPSDEKRRLMHKVMGKSTPLYAVRPALFGEEGEAS